MAENVVDDWLRSTLLLLSFVFIFFKMLLYYIWLINSVVKFSRIELHRLLNLYNLRLL